MIYYDCISYKIPPSQIPSPHFVQPSCLHTGRYVYRISSEIPPSRIRVPPPFTREAKGAFAITTFIITQIRLQVNKYPRYTGRYLFYGFAIFIFSLPDHAFSASVISLQSFNTISGLSMDSAKICSSVSPLITRMLRQPALSPLLTSV